MRAGDELTVQSYRSKRGNSEPTDTSLVKKKSPNRMTSPRSSDFIDEESQNGIFLDALYQTEPKFMLDLEGQKPKFSPKIDPSKEVRNPFRPNTMSKFVFKSLKVQHSNEEENYPSSGNLQLLNLKDYRTKSSIDPSDFNHSPPTRGSFQDEMELKPQHTFDDLKSDMKKQDRKSISSNGEEKIQESEPTKEGWMSTVAQFFTQKSRRGSSIMKEKADFKLSQRQYGIINDKAFILNKDVNIVGHKRRYSQRKKEQPRLKQLLQKHKIVKANLQTDFVKRIIAKIKRRKRGLLFSFYDSIKKRCKKMFEYASDIKRSIWRLAIPVSPLGKFKTCWDFVAIVLTFYELVFIPFQIGFEYDPVGTLAYYELIKDFFFIFDILLMFHTAPLHDNNDNTDVFVKHRKIANTYLRGYFAFDLVASLPYREIVNQQFGDDDNSSSLFLSHKLARFILLLRVLRIIRISKIFARLKDKMHSQVVTGIISLVNLFVNVIFLAHIVACTWHFVAMEGERETSRSWISTFGFLDESIPERYIASLYWAILTMITVGYGDITAVTMPERIVNICVMLLGCGVFGYSMNSIGILLQNINSGVSKKRQRYYLINKFMSRKQLSKETQSRVNQYMDYLFESQNENKSDENTILAMLSDGIQEQIKREINGKVLKENKLFQRIFGTKFLALLSHYLEEKIYSPSEIIYDESDKNFGIYFVSSGSVEIFMGGSQQTVQSLEKGDYFGELAFFTNTVRKFGARSSSFSSIFLIQKNTFLEIAEDYPAEKEMYYTIKDRVNLYQDYKVLRMICYSCGKRGHYISNCPYLHYIPSRRRVAGEYLKEHQMFCKTFKRGLRKRFHVLKQIEQLEFTARMMVNNHRSGKQGFLPRRMSQTIVPIHSFPLPNPKDEVEGTGTARGGDAEQSFDPNNNFPADLKKAQTFIPRTDSGVLSRFRTEDFKNSIKTGLDSEDGIGESTVNMKPISFLDRSPLQSLRDNEVVFDTVMNFQIYFPHNNITKIIENMNKEKMRKNKIKEIQNQIEGLKAGAEKPASGQASFTNIPLPLPSGGQSPSTSPVAAGQSPINLKSKYWGMLFRVESMNSVRNRKDSDMNSVMDSVPGSPQNRERLRPRRVTISQEAPEFREFHVDRENGSEFSKSFLESPLMKPKPPFK